MKKFLKMLVLSLLTAALLCCALPGALAADSAEKESKESVIYTVGLDAMGGSSSTVALSTGLNGRLTALPKMEGYTFDGWYTEPVGGSKISTSTVFTGDTTVYAHWTVKNASTATAPSAPAEPAKSSEITEHLGVVVVAGVLLGTIALAFAL